MAQLKISEYPAKTVFNDGDLYDVSTFDGASTYTSEKLTFAQLKAELNSVLNFVSTNLYTADGTISANRTVTMGGNSLTLEQSATQYHVFQSNGEFRHQFNADNFLEYEPSLGSPLTVTSNTATATGFRAVRSANNIELLCRSTLPRISSNTGIEHYNAGSLTMYTSNVNTVGFGIVGDLTSRIHVDGNARVDGGLTINGAGSNQFTVSDSTNFSQFGNTTQLTDEIVRVGGSLRAVGISVGNVGNQGNFYNAPQAGGYAINGIGILQAGTSKGTLINAILAGGGDQITLQVSGSLEALQVKPERSVFKTYNASSGTTLRNQQIELLGHYWDGANQQTQSIIKHTSVDVSGAYKLGFEVGGSEQMYIDNSGNVIMANLPTSSAGLPTGALWNNSGVLNIV